MPTLDSVIDKLNTRFFVDIGASNSPADSQSEKLIGKGWSGIMFECDPNKYDGLVDRMKSKNVIVIGDKVTPDNIIEHLSTNNVPNQFYLSIDIDGYDYFVLDKILSKYSPELIISEINEKIPPPIEFTVLYDKNYWWDVSHFYGYSLAMLTTLLEKYEYKIDSLDYNNVILVKGKQTTPLKEIYDNGYWNRNRFYYNVDFEPIYYLKKEQQIEFINKKFKNYEGKYLLDNRIHIENSGQVRLTSDLGKWISQYARDERFTKFVEIGTWNGRGSTCCFYDGFIKRTSSYSLQSYEIMQQRALEAKELWKNVPQIQIIHGRILNDEEFPEFTTVQKLFPSVNVEWHEEDTRNFHSCPYVPMNNPQVVLLDGAEYLTYFEFEKIKDSIHVFILDDVNVDKCSAIYHYLKNNSHWKCVAEGSDRHGWAVFEKVNDSSE